MTTIHTQPIDDDIGSITQIDGECYVKLSSGDSVPDKMLIDNSVVASKDYTSPTCNRVQILDDAQQETGGINPVITPVQLTASDISTGNIERVTGKYGLDGCNFGDYRCIDIPDNNCSFNICRCKYGAWLQLELKNPIIGIDYADWTCKTNSSGSRSLSVRADGIWYTLTGNSILNRAGWTGMGVQTQWIDFTSGLVFNHDARHYEPRILMQSLPNNGSVTINHGNDGIISIPSYLPPASFWSRARIDAIRMNYGFYTTGNGGPTFSIYQVNLKKDGIRKPIMYKPAIIAFSDYDNQ